MDNRESVAFGRVQAAALLLDRAWGKCDRSRSAAIPTGPLIVEIIQRVREPNDGRRPLYAPDWVPADQPTRDDEKAIIGKATPIGRHIFEMYPRGSTQFAHWGLPPRSTRAVRHQRDMLVLVTNTQYCSACWA